jgi:hypothetical protein
MKRASIIAKTTVGNPEGVLGDLLIVAAVFVALNAFSSWVLPVHAGGGGWFYVGAYDNNRAFIYHCVKGKQHTAYFEVGPQWQYNAVGSYVFLAQSNFDFFAVGFVKGWTQPGPSNPNPIWLSTPYYYVDRELRGEYDFWLFEQAPIGTQPHEYWISGSITMGAMIDRILEKSEGGYLSSGNRAAGMTETHDTLDQMNSHFFNMRAGESFWAPYAFHDDYIYVDSLPPIPDFPYSIYMVSDTEWTATGQGSS